MKLVYEIFSMIQKFDLTAAFKMQNLLLHISLNKHMWEMGTIAMSTSRPGPDHFEYRHLSFRVRSILANE